MSDRVTSMGERILLQNGTTLGSAYKAEPASPTFGVIVIQEWWGVVPHIERVADRFAAEGFLAVVPDLYDGRTATAPGDAQRLMMGLQIETAARQIASAGRFLRNTLGRRKVGVVGFCMGGALALYSACRDDDIGACVVFYGSHPSVQPDLPSLQAPVLGLYAGRDTHVTPADVTALGARLTASGKRHRFHVYPDARHAFFNEDSPAAYDPAAAADAWHRTVGFLRQELSQSA